MRNTAPERNLGEEEPEDTGRSHLTTTVERGSFVSARCGCGWRGPARRARDTAYTDAAGHSAA